MTPSEFQLKFENPTASNIQMTEASKPKRTSDPENNLLAEADRLKA
jgi:hypothetical protein